MGITATRKRWPPSQEDRLNARHEIARRTVAVSTAGLKVDWKRLDDDEARDLVALTGKPESELSKRERAKWETLAEKGSGQPGVFARIRDAAGLRARLSEIAVDAAKPPRRVRYEEDGSVVLPRELVFAYLNRPDPAVWVEHLGLYAFVMSQLENGRALTPGGRIDGGGDTATLVLRRDLGIGSQYDPEHRLTKWLAALEHLQRNGWLTVRRRGQEVFVGRGAKALKAAAGRTT